MNEAQTTETSSRAARVIARCRELARITDVLQETTRLFLSPATRDAHTLLQWWIRQAGLDARVDDVGNVRAIWPCAADANAPTLLLFSHIDTVPNAGAFDGPLGVLLALAVLEELTAIPLPFHIELIAFSEEEGVRFRFPFLSSFAATGQLTEEQLSRTDAAGISVAEAIRNFGLDPSRIASTSALSTNTFAALEVHIEQGPVLESENASLAVVETIVGQSRLELTFTGQSNHAGTTPMPQRRDALAAAAQWIVEVERYAANYTQLVATVGQITAMSAELRGVKVHAALKSEQRAVPMDRELTIKLHEAATQSGFDTKSMFSGAGHDAMIIAPFVPTTMLFLCSPGGLSHHPDETVREEDVEAAIATLLYFLVHLQPKV
jgi:allantoate deiminase